MNSSSRYYLVAAEVLPEIFIKVAEANRLLKAGEVATAGDAAKAVGISRSAYYKYRDAIQPFTDMTTGHIITFYALLKNRSGVLSNVLSVFARYPNLRGQYPLHIQTYQIHITISPVQLYLKHTATCHPVRSRPGAARAAP